MGKSKPNKGLLKSLEGLSWYCWDKGQPNRIRDAISHNSSTFWRYVGEISM